MSYLSQTVTATRGIGNTFALVLAGSFMVVLDSTSVGVALPAIAADLSVASGVEWCVSIYLLAVGMVLPASAWIADRLGRERAYSWSLATFTLGSMLAALAPNFTFLLAARAVQAVGGAAMIPVGLAIIYDRVPSHRSGEVIALWGLVVMAAPAIGPALGGYLVTTASWRWIFAVNVPMGLVAVGSRFSANVVSADRKVVTQRFDAAGVAAGSAALAMIFGMFSILGTTDPDPAAAMALGGGGLLLFALFIYIELQSSSPALDLSLFSHPHFGRIIVLVWATTIVQFVRLVFVPLELQVVQHMTALAAGIALIPAAAGAAAGMWLAGVATGKRGPRQPAMWGLILLAAGNAAYALFGDSDVPGVRILLLATQGLAAGLAVMPLTIAVMLSVDDGQSTQASVIRAINRQISGAAGVAALSAIVTKKLGSLTPETADSAAVNSAYDLVFYLAAALSALALPLAMRLPRNTPGDMNGGHHQDPRHSQGT